MCRFFVCQKLDAACEGRPQTSRIGAASREVGSDRQNIFRPDVLLLMFRLITFDYFLAILENFTKCFTLAGTPVVSPSLAAFSFSNLETSPLAGETFMETNLGGSRTP